MKSRQSNLPAIAAAKAGFSTPTAYRIPIRGCHRRRKSPEDVGVPTRSPECGTARSCRCWTGLRAVAIFEEICRRHPEIALGVRRTLERRVARWGALNGANRDVIFRQEHPPGRMGLRLHRHGRARHHDRG
jgi:hypothetical protein